MAELVREHHLHLLRRKPVDQRVADEDPAGPAEADDGRVRDAALAREVGDGDLGRPHVHPLGQGQEPGAQRGVVERRQPVEDRHQPDRDDGRQQDRAAGQDDARPEPPPGRAPAEERVHHLDHEQPEPASDGEHLRAVGEPGPEPLRGQARSTREDEAAQHVERERQQRLGAADDQRHGRDDRGGRQVEPRVQADDQARRGAAGAPAHQQGGADREIGEREPELPTVVAARLGFDVGVHGLRA